MAEHSGEKTHDATPHRRQEARKKGHVATSHDLGSVSLLIAGILVLMMSGGPLLERIEALTLAQLGDAAWLTADTQFVLAQCRGTLALLAAPMLIILGLFVVASVLASVMQVGFLFVPERIALDFSRINPLQGWQRLVSISSAVRLVFGIVKVLVIAAVTGYCLRKQWPEILAIGAHETAEIAAFVVDIILWTTLKIGLALLVLAVLDYAYHRWKHEQDLRMTHQEMREELKDFQGDPQIMARRRAVQRQLVLHRLADIVPKADVVITNPTELAIAIQYVPEEMAAPIVVAKGAGVIAERIRRLALEHNIPLVEKKPLAQALYREVEINQAIPDKMYAAVAEVLAYVYQLKGKTLPKAPASAA